MKDECISAKLTAMSVSRWAGPRGGVDGERPYRQMRMLSLQSRSGTYIERMVPKVFLTLLDLFFGCVWTELE